MEISPTDQIDFKNASRSMKIVSLIGTLIMLTLTSVELIPLDPGYVFTFLGFLSNLLNFIGTTQSFTLNKHFLNLTFALSPIWILCLDPCAMTFAQALTAMNIFFTSIEQKNNLFRKIYTAIMISSWFLIFIAKGTLALEDCQESISTHMRRDIIMILIISPMLLIVCSVQMDSHFKATREALSQVKELNSKFESLNAELKQHLDNKDNFILLFSHETRNPLNILLGNLSLLLDEIDAPKIKARLTRCKFCADLLLHHLNNILDTGKLTSQGSLEVTPMPVKIYEYIQSTASFMDMLVKKKNGLKSELIIPEKLPANLKFDPHRVAQVILNLLTNAAKFTEAGSITMVIRYLKTNRIGEADYYPTTLFGHQLLNQPQREDTISEFLENPMGNGIHLREQFQRRIETLDERKNCLLETTEEKGFLKIEINDTGCGMKEEDLKKLFQKFSQTHSEGSQRQIGSGLGLWISKVLCELMNGGIRVFSKPKIGTCFSAIIQADCLPASTPPLSKLITSPDSSSSRALQKRANSFFPPQENDQAPLILCFDNDVFNLDCISEMLEGLGAKARRATSGEELLSQFKSIVLKEEKRLDFVLIDCRMSEMDGWTACRLMKETLRAHNMGDIPIIGLSGEDKESNIKNVKFSGIEDMIQKPLTRGDLMMLLGKYASRFKRTM